jgi:hypothetical protein
VHFESIAGAVRVEKGSYEYGKDEFGEYINFIFQYYNYGQGEDQKYEQPLKQNYYIVSNNGIFILYKRNGEFDGYSIDNYIFINGEYAATSTLIENANKPKLYEPNKLSINHLLNDFWAEGAKGDGKGETIKVKFKYPELFNGQEQSATVNINGIQNRIRI